MRGSRGARGCVRLNRNSRPLWQCRGATGSGLVLHSRTLQTPCTTPTCSWTTRSRRISDGGACVDEAGHVGSDECVARSGSLGAVRGVNCRLSSLCFRSGASGVSNNFDLGPGLDRFSKKIGYARPAPSDAWHAKIGNVHFGGHVHYPICVPVEGRF